MNPTGKPRGSSHDVAVARANLRDALKLNDEESAVVAVHKLIAAKKRGQAARVQELRDKIGTKSS